MKKNFQELETQTSLARERLKNAIRALPDSADGVKMLAPNCCTVSFSLITQTPPPSSSGTLPPHGFTLSPRYWLTRETKAQLINLIDSSRSVETLVKAVEAVLTTGKLRDGSTIPPNVLGALKAAWEGDY